MTASNLVKFKKTQIDSLMTRAHKVVRKALRVSTEFSNDQIALSLENEGCDLRPLSLMMSTSTADTLILLMNKNLPTGSKAMIESISQAIELPGYKTSHVPLHLRNGPFCFSPLSKNSPFEKTEEHEETTEEKATRKPQQHFYRLMCQSIAHINKDTGMDIKFFFRPSLAATINNMIPLVPVPMDS
jgi:hypothetical protein